MVVCSSAGRNTAALGDVNQVRIGLPETAFCAATTVYSDSVKVAKSYIGPEPSALLVQEITESPTSPLIASEAQHQAAKTGKIPQR